MTTTTGFTLEVCDRFNDSNCLRYRATITGADDDWRLQWCDGQETWTEDYDALSVTLARLAVLQKCAEDDWHSSFEHDEIEFPSHARGFLSQASSTF